MADKKKKMMERTMEAKTATLLKYMMDMELQNLKDKVEADMAFFIGVDGRIFASKLPNVMNHNQFYLFNLVKAMLPSICAQLKNENLRVSVMQYPEGVLLISGVGKNSFLVTVKSGDVDITNAVSLVAEPVKAGAVMLHIFEQRSMEESELEKLPEDIRDELKSLSRQLFVEQFDQTRGYKKNMKILEWLKSKLTEAVGIGSQDEILTLVFNEIGTSAPYMNDKLWRLMTEKIIQDHVRKLRGDIVADECYTTWLAELEQKLKSFV